MASITKEAIKREFMTIEEYSLQNFYRALYNATEVTKDTSSGDIINEWGRINKTIENTCIHDIIETCIYFLIFLKLKKFGVSDEHLHGVISNIKETWNGLIEAIRDDADEMTGLVSSK